MRLALFAGAIARRRQKLLLGASNPPSASQSSLTPDTASVVTANGSSTIAYTGVIRDENGVELAGVTGVTVEAVEWFPLSRILADSVVSVSSPVIASDGVEEVTITVLLLGNRSGGTYPLVGVAAADIAVAVSGTNNTIAPLSGTTDENGSISTTFTTTQAATVKTISATLFGDALTSTDTCESDGTPPAAEVYAESDFTGGTISPFTNPWGDRITVISDPTGSGRGNLAQITYAPSSGGSMERGLKYTHGSQIRYGETIWLKGDFYQVAGSGDYDANHNRKLIDYQGSGVRVTLHRRDGVLRFSAVDRMATGVQTEVVAETTGIALADDTWYTIEVEVVTNSADDLRDGEVRVYINESVTADYERTSGLGWITENGGASYFQNFFTGFQLTIDSGDGTYTDTRYWDNITYSSARI